ncbi:ABC transporter permease [Actinopolymorpha pittospori]|uniref:Osmoprotectant transport system permease protein n=1 Tax=Actinopolymorpha pittospori TaxID=648752 RepID=A0A927MR22_9ACTN|nr:ABC transporter permease [Actinopolymorpha pittospori]MBE1605316.1 osmoprotectant transport system permease protein [Actinopolymorpha pittospori]
MIEGIFRWFADPDNWSGSAGIPMRVLEHLEYSVVALLIAALIGIPLGLFIGHTGKGTFFAAGLANALRSLPSLGLLVLMALILGSRISSDLVYVIPSIVVLVVLAVPPILASTYAGVQGVDPAARDAAYGMGMTGWDVLRRVEAPCALPLILSGVRSAMLQIIATATIAAITSLGGLGRYIVDGQAVRDYSQMVAGSILVALLAIVVEAVLAGVQRLVVPAGLTGRDRQRRTPDTERAATARDQELVSAR